MILLEPPERFVFQIAGAKLDQHVAAINFQLRIEQFFLQLIGLFFYRLALFQLNQQFLEFFCAFL